MTASVLPVIGTGDDGLRASLSFSHPAIGANAHCSPAGPNADDESAPSQAALAAHLLAIFPVTARILDPGFFAVVIDDHIERLEGAAPEVADFARSLPHFLATLPACRRLRYVGDVARFEWLLQQVREAANHRPLDAAALAAGLDATPRLRFRLAPAYELLASLWPVDRIWRAHQAASFGGIRVDGRLRHIELWRSDGRLRCRRLSTADYRFRRGLQMGVPLAAAAAAALDADRRFDLTAALACVLHQGIVADLSLDAEAA